jgi:hypothetical protein
MDEQAQVAEVRRRRSRAEVERLMAGYEASGLSRVEFCRKHGLSLSTLVRYRRRRAQADTAPGNRWLAVEVPSGGAALAPGVSTPLVLALPGGRRIEVGQGFDAQTLVQLLRVLERI